MVQGQGLESVFILHDSVKMANESEYKYLPRPDNASSMSPSDARALFRRNNYYGSVNGFCLGYAMANLLVIPKDMADDFEELCRKNSGPLPLLFRSGAGEVGAPPLAADSNVRTDLPRYFIYSKGRIVEDTLDLGGFKSMWEDFVSFYLGCSYSFETAFIESGIDLANTRMGKNVSMYTSNVDLKSVGPFSGKMVVSMRMIPIAQLDKAFTISSQYPEHHGAPVHIGDPSRIGIDDIMKPDKGDPPMEVQEGDVPVFWACGVTVKEAIASAKPSLAFTHYPGSMFITDVKVEPKILDDSAVIVQLSQPADAYFASVINHKSLAVFEELERLLLDDPGRRGVAHLFQKSDLLKATLSLSHSRSVAITTGYPACTEFDIKEETDGLPGALAICRALITLCKEVTLVVDEDRESLYRSCVEYAVEIGTLEGDSLAVVSFEKAKERLQQVDDSCSTSRSAYDCLIAIERAGRNERGTYCTMKGQDISKFVQPVDQLFDMARKNPHIATIGIGDGGNELGMGKVYDSVVKNIPLGETIACSVAADYLIAAGVSNWGGYALACGLFVASSSPVHWRYRNGAIDADHPPKVDINKFLPTADQTSSLLKRMNELGFRDGVTKSLDQSVDGQPLPVHLKKLSDITKLAENNI